MQKTKSKTTQRRTKTLLVTLAVAALAWIAAVPCVAAADEVKVANPGAMVTAATQVQINEAALKQAEVDVDGDDSKLGDQPGDVNDDAYDQAGDDLGWQGNNDVQPPTVKPPKSGTPTPTPEPTPTPKPQQPKKSTRGQLAYTGGNETAFLLIGTLIALVGSAVLVATVLSRKTK